MHDSHVVTDHHDTVTRIYAEEIISAFHDQMQEAERLAAELHNLLLDYETMVEQEGMPDRMETLVRWAERYSSELSAAGKISRDGNAWLRGFSNRLNPGLPASETRPKVHNLLDAATPLPPKRFAGAAKQVGKITPPAAEYGRELFPVRRFRGQ